MSQPHRNQSVVRQPTVFKSERSRISNPRCDSQVDVHNDLSKPVTTHYLPKEREDASVKPHHMITSSNSMFSSKNMPRFTSNDMVHNHYLEEAKKNSELGLHDHNNNQSSSKLVPDVVPQADKSATSRQELELLFHHHLTMLRKSTIKRDVYAYVPSQQELDILFGPLYDEFFNA
nr:hypothetical protein [Tanacetum cinerariifolium]